MADRALVIAAHPDDAEFGAGGTTALWTQQGREVFYVVCTRGDKGSSDPEMTPERLATLREEEQRAAARTLGVREVVFLGFSDGGLEDTPELRRELVRYIRLYRPKVVVTSEPLHHRQRIWHRDHRIVGQSACDAVFPYARDRLHFSELLAQGLEPHKVEEVYLWGSEEPDTFIDISQTIELKVQALRCHASQVNSHSRDIEHWVRERCATAGQAIGAAYAEGFRRLVIPF
ncbi:MAG: PIG-L family deacetylase [Chloroflexi bacterium]|nr:PIG-L family deacetylase [Chloroflexota bacterium]